MSKPKSPVGPATTTINEKTRQSLFQLHTQMKQAEHTYNTAVNAVLVTLGIDPEYDNTLDLDTGVLTSAEKK